MNGFFIKNERGLRSWGLFAALSLSLFLGETDAQQTGFFSPLLEGSPAQNPASIVVGGGQVAGARSYRQWVRADFGAPQSDEVWYAKNLTEQRIAIGGWLGHERLGPLRQTTVGGSYAYGFSPSGEDVLAVGGSAIGAFSTLAASFNVQDAADPNLPTADARRASQFDADLGLAYRSEARGERSYWFGSLAARRLVSEQLGAGGTPPGLRRSLHGRGQLGFRRVHDFWEFELRADTDWAFRDRWRGQLAARFEAPQRFWAEVFLSGDFSYGLAAGFFLPTASGGRVAFGLEAGLPGQLVPVVLGPSLGAAATYRWGE